MLVARACLPQRRPAVAGHAGQSRYPAIRPATPSVPSASGKVPCQARDRQRQQRLTRPRHDARPAPTLSRRHVAGAPSARGLLFTLLGEFVLTGDGSAWTSAVIAALARLGVEEKATRQALMRTAAAGWLRAEKAGRRTRWHLTDSARQLLTDGAERIFSFTGPAENWDGRWLLVAARIPESDRSARHVVRNRLSWAGFGSLGPGLWISTHPEREAEVTQVLREAGIADDAHLFVATRSGLADVRAMVSAAWDLAEIEREYEQFIDEFSDRGRTRRARAAGRAGARLAPVPGHRPRAAPRTAAGPVERPESGQALRRPARALVRRGADGVETSQRRRVRTTPDDTGRGPHPTTPGEDHTRRHRARTTPDDTGERITPHPRRAAGGMQPRRRCEPEGR